MKLIPHLAHIDRQATEVCGIPGLTLMESAGERVAEAVLAELSEPGSERIPVLIVCGPGNNGGDGFVAARLLARTGRCTVTVLHTSDRHHGDAKVNFERLNAVPQVTVRAAGDGDCSDNLEVIENARLIVDALFGSGLSRPIEGKTARLIERINGVAGARVISVDLPSGIDGASGQVRGVAVRADETVTLAAAKPGLYLQPGKAHAGRVTVADIGIPTVLMEADESPYRLITPENARSWLPKRDPMGHKYTFGSVLVLAGSRAMPGASALTGEAALRAGCGYVTLAAPASVFGRVRLSPEIVQAPLAETPDGTLARSTLEVILQVVRDKKVNTLAIGPGLGQDPDTVALLAHLLPRLSALPGLPTLVLDADALNALVRLDEARPALSPHVILTPHVGEAARLLGQDGADINADLPRAAQALQSRFGAQIVLKSASSVMASPDGLLWISPTGNSGMAKAGSGDVLTGIIAALAAQGASPDVAARLGVYLHGRAGDAAAAHQTPYAMSAGDITRHLPQAFREITSGS